jgi:hypothetical protein
MFRQLLPNKNKNTITVDLNKASLGRVFCLCVRARAAAFRRKISFGAVCSGTGQRTRANDKTQ